MTKTTTPDPLERLGDYAKRKYPDGWGRRSYKIAAPENALDEIAKLSPKRRGEILANALRSNQTR